MDMSIQPETSLDINVCLYQEWYKFHTCSIRSCKNYTEVTKSKCLAIDRVQPVGSKVISDSELHYFKFSDKNVSTRLISLKRKKAVTRVKAILILNSLIEYIRDECKPVGEELSGKAVEKLESSYPLKIKKLGYARWMLPYIVDEKFYKKFLKKKEGECSSFKLCTILSLTPMKFERLLTQLKENQREHKK